MRATNNRPAIPPRLPALVALAIAGPLVFLVTFAVWSSFTWRYFRSTLTLPGLEEDSRAMFWASELPAGVFAAATVLLVASVAIYLCRNRHGWLGLILSFYGILVVVAIGAVSFLLIPFKPPGI